MAELIQIDMGIRNSVVIPARLEARKLFKHQQKRSVLNHVTRKANRNVGSPLKHMQVKPPIDNPNVHPTMTGSDRRDSSSATARYMILRNPRSNEVGTCFRIRYYLLDHLLKLIDVVAIAHGITPKCTPIRAWAQITCGQT